MADYLDGLRARIPEEIGMKRRNAVLSGTFDDDAFQIALTEKDDEEDVINLELFDQLGYHCVPHLGVYGDNYDPFVPFVLVKLPTENLFKRAQRARDHPESQQDIEGLPASLVSRLDHNPLVLNDCFVMIHPRPIRSECQHLTCSETNEINLMFHTWVFQGMKLDSEETCNVIHVGAFECEGIFPTHMEAQDEAYRGTPIEETGPRLLILHFSKFSPLNNQIKMADDVPYYSFFSFAQLGPLFHPTKQVITFHLLPGSDELESTLRDVVRRSSSVLDLLEKLSSVSEISSPVETIHRLVASSLVPFSDPFEEIPLTSSSSSSSDL
eukprot:TRINITY_DN10334_c0_g2_i1.p1 TRINITY_DN10334_c0_g2~~TRINITY_DN10334_c0_g2_i1.p1  ORF type:complete len:325 (+),score=114.66 TRINITY_DN10334_c0_g2_i1:25-999(+)